MEDSANCRGDLDNDREEIENNEEGNDEAREEIDCASSPEEENPDTSHDEHRHEVSSLRRHIDSGLDQLSSLYKKLQRWYGNTISLTFPFEVVFFVDEIFLFANMC